jgi:hypothetical protein
MQALEERAIQNVAGERPRAPWMSVVFSPKPSERRFGFTLAAGLAVLGIRGIVAHWSWAAYGACFVASLVCGLCAYAIPHALAPLNKILTLLGERIGKILTPILLGIIFFGILTPIAVLARILGRDELRLKRRAANSYWHNREPLDSTNDSFRNQY